MKLASLRATTAIALVLGATAAYAQVQQKEQNTGPADKQGQVQTQERTPDAGAAATQNKDEPKGKAAERKSEPKEKAAQKKAEPSEKATKGTAQKDAEPKEKATKGNAQNSGDKPAANKAAEKTPSINKATKAGTEQRPKLSEQQQTRVRETVLKQKGERTNVQFTVSIGTRVPRSVRLAPLPAVVFDIVPEYRNYRYVVVRDDVVIVDPNTYEIVYVLPGRSSTASGGGLMLTDEQIGFVLRNIDLKSDSRLGIGGLQVGADVPRDGALREFPATVVEKVPELRSYRYLVHENDVAIVDPRESKIVIVTPAQR